MPKRHEFCVWSSVIWGIHELNYADSENVTITRIHSEPDPFRLSILISVRRSMSTLTDANIIYTESIIVFPTLTT